MTKNKLELWEKRESLYYSTLAYLDRMGFEETHDFIWYRKLRWTWDYARK